MPDTVTGIPLLRKLLDRMANYTLKTIKLLIFMCYDCVSAAYYYNTLVLKGM